MANITLSNITKYPVKSTTGLSTNQSDITTKGLEHDRRWAIINTDNKVITARELPEILKILCKIGEQGFYMSTSQSKCFVPFSVSTDPTPITLFSSEVQGIIHEPSINDWLTDVLKQDCRLVFMGDNCVRPVQEKSGGTAGDTVSYADECPILLTSESSLSDLNSRLTEEMSMERFRPNLIVKGTSPYEETTWKHIRIGTSEFEVVQECKRCVFITIDPTTGEKHPNQEPLRTLATYRKHPRGGASFGVHLIPRKIGTIKKGDCVEVIS